MHSDRARRSAISRAIAIIGYGAQCALLVAALALCALCVVGPRLIGAVPLTVLSDSMSPTMRVGSLAIVQPTMPLQIEPSKLSAAEIDAMNEVSDISVGDVIVFQPQAQKDTLIIHRVINVGYSLGGTPRFLTRGDGNGRTDDPVEAHQVRAKLLYFIPMMGYVNNAVDERSGLLIGAVTAGVFYISAALYVRKAWKARREGRISAPSHRTPFTPGWLSSGGAGKSGSVAPP